MPQSFHDCEKCGFIAPGKSVAEPDVMTLILGAQMHSEVHNCHGKSDRVIAGIKAISLELDAEFQKEGIQHPLAGKTFSEIRLIAAAGDLPTEGSEIRIKRRDAEMEEWNRRVRAEELTEEQKERVIKGVTSSDAILEQLGWVNPY